MFFQIVRLNEQRQAMPILLHEWHVVVDNDPCFFWAQSDPKDRFKNAAVYFIDDQDVRGMDWFLQDNGTFKFKNNHLSLGHPYIQKIFAVAEQLSAQVLQDNEVVLTFVDSSYQAPVNTLLPEDHPIQHTSPAAPELDIASKALVTKPTTTDNGFATEAPRYDYPVVEVKPQRPKNLTKLKRKIKELTAINHLKLYTTNQQIAPGEDFQGELIAHKSAHTTDGYYLVRNIWVELILQQGTTYTFRVQAPFMVELPKAVYVYHEGSKIVLDQKHISLGRKG
jgi:hypothetical protein